MRSTFFTVVFSAPTHGPSLTFSGLLPFFSLNLPSLCVADQRKIRRQQKTRDLFCRKFFCLGSLCIQPNTANRNLPPFAYCRFRLHSQIRMLFVSSNRRHLLVTLASLEPMMEAYNQRRAINPSLSVQYMCQSFLTFSFLQMRTFFDD